MSDSGKRERLTSESPSGPSGNADVLDDFNAEVAATVSGAVAVLEAIARGDEAAQEGIDAEAMHRAAGGTDQGLAQLWLLALMGTGKFDA